MNQKTLYKVFIWGFLVLYLFVAGISFFHAIQFFCIGNPLVMSVVLAFAFELGLALSLAAVLLSDANKKATLPWVLMIILTAVQVIGNVYSVEKYICESDAVYYQYLSNALLFWIEEVSESAVQVIVSWIMGAILPIIALFMTDMVATNIKNMSALKESERPESLPEDTVVSSSNQMTSHDNDINKVEVKNVDPVEVQAEDSEKPQQSNKSISNKLNNIFATKIGKESKEPDSGQPGVVNAPKEHTDSMKYHTADPTFFKSPEV